MDKKKNNYTREWARNYVSGLIKKGAFKVVLAWVAKKAACLTVGPLGWLFSLVLEQLWDYFGDKAVKWAMRKGALGIDTASGHIKAIKIKDARKNGTTTDYDSAVDSVFD